MERLEKRSRRKRILNKSMDKSPQKGNQKDIKIILNKSEKVLNIKSKVKSSELLKKQSPRNPQEILLESQVKHSGDFQLNLNKNMTQFQKQKIKSERRKIFNEKVSRIPVNVNESKKLKMLIAIDKSMNPLKYQIMGRKGFTEEEIYHETK